MAFEASRRFRPAQSSETAMLSALALRSKSHWDYTREQLGVFREELTLDEADLRNTAVLEDGAEIRGFYTLASRSDGILEIEHLFVDPDHLREGCGAELLEHALDASRLLGGIRVHVQSDPNAAGFYSRFGFVKLREIPTSIPGRTLPLMERVLEQRSDSIVIEEPRFDWPEKFRVEVERVRGALPDAPVLRFEHFGSTAVPGLAAKPILDFAMLVPSPANRPEWILPIEALGYEHWGENPDPGRMLFIKGKPPNGSGRTHHFHVRGSDDLTAELEFRDALRADATLAARYVRLKRELASAAGEDREAYTEGKSEFIRASREGRS